MKMQLLLRTVCGGPATLLPGGGTQNFGAWASLIGGNKDP